MPPPTRLQALEVAANDLTPDAPGPALARALLLGEISLDELRRGYIVHAVTLKGSCTEAAELLGIDRRTVRDACEADGGKLPPRRGKPGKRG